MTTAEKKARELISNATLSDLIDEWELTSTINTPEIYTVRGWLMDEFEERFPEEFNAWLESDALDEELKYYLIKA